MANYTVTFARSARKELESLPEQRCQDRIMAADREHLTRIQRSRGCRKLSGEQNLWRLRVGEYRVIYSVDDGQQAADITAVRNRKDAYR